MTEVLRARCITKVGEYIGLQESGARQVRQGFLLGEGVRRITGFAQAFGQLTIDEVQLRLLQANDGGERHKADLFQDGFGFAQFLIGIAQVPLEHGSLGLV